MGTHATYKRLRLSLSLQLLFSIHQTPAITTPSHIERLFDAILKSYEKKTKKLWSLLPLEATCPCACMRRRFVVDAMTTSMLGVSPTDSLGVCFAGQLVQSLAYAVLEHALRLRPTPPAELYVNAVAIDWLSDKGEVGLLLLCLL
jgi:hypothetical protein